MIEGEPDDAELVAQALSGRQLGFTLLLRRYREPVYRLVRNNIGDPSEALDVTQECFISAFAALNRYDPTRPFKSWVLRIALNKCRDWGRRRAVRKLFAFARPLDEAYDIADGAPDPEASLAARGEAERLRGALAELPAKLKDPLILCALEELSQDEAARVLGVSRKAVETRIYRARQKLTQILEG
ncbi:MAG: RNA polymerase sigma factor [Novosphingobium sp.]